jgi:GMP synthase (glutamine-hydrolysing)
MPRILLLKVGRTFEDIARERGDYDRWFQQGLGLGDDEIDVVPVCDGAPLPASYAYDGVVITGSWAMVTDREPWSEQSAVYLREAVARGLPLLGVCYGHQLLAHAYGGLVGYNPRGRHAGTAEVTLTQAAASDALLGGFESPLIVQVSHAQSVIELPAEATLLATCPGDPHHAFRIGACAWGVQFHPEFDAAVSRAYIAQRSATIAAEGLDPTALMHAVRDTGHGGALLRRFRDLLSTEGLLPL